jgi:hypothetical protein
MARSRSTFFHCVRCAKNYGLGRNVKIVLYRMFHSCSVLLDATF